MLIQWASQRLLPSLDLSFVGGDSLDSRVTFTRASSGMRVDSTGTLVSMGTDAPRFDYDPLTLAIKGLLIEEQRSNILLWSEQFDNAGGWSKAGCTITANAINSPDGTQTADALVEDGTTGLHLAQQFVSFTSGTAYTLSLMVKPGARSWIELLLPAAAFGASQGGFYNLSGAGALGTTVGTPTSRTITQLANGWYLITVTASATATAGGNVAIVAASADNTASYAGSNGSVALYPWGADLQVGAFRTSYIPTTTAAATRAADVAVVSSLAGWFNSAQGTLLAEFIPNAPASSATNQYIAALSDNSLSNRVSMFRVPSTGLQANRITSAGTGANPGDGAASTTAAVNKVAIAYGAGTNQGGASVNGGVVTLSSPAAVPTGISQLSLGCSESTSAAYLNGWLRRIPYYPTRLPDSTIRALTS